MRLSVKGKMGRPNKALSEATSHLWMIGGGREGGGGTKEGEGATRRELEMGMEPVVAPLVLIRLSAVTVCWVVPGSENQRVQMHPTRCADGCHHHQPCVVPLRPPTDRLTTSWGIFRQLPRAVHFGPFPSSHSLVVSPALSLLFDCTALSCILYHISKQTNAVTQMSLSLCPRFPD